MREGCGMRVVPVLWGEGALPPFLRWDTMPKTVNSRIQFPGKDRMKFEKKTVEKLQKQRVRCSW